MNDNLKEKNEAVNHMIQHKNKYPSGVLRGVLLFPVGLILSILIGIASGQSIGALWGVIIGILVCIIFVVVIVMIINRSQTLTVFDCLLPTIISFIAAFAFSPVTLFSGNIFSIGTCIFSGVLLSVGLFLYKSDKIQGAYLILPTLAFLYEILPIDLPTDLDNILALSVNTLDLATGWIVRRQLVAKNKPKLELQETDTQKTISSSNDVRK